MHDRLDQAGWWSHTSGTSLAPAQQIWLSVSSPDFNAVLEVIDPAGQVVARISDERGGAETGAFFKAAGEPSSSGESRAYTLRITSDQAGVIGRWRVEDRRDGSNAPMFANVFPDEAPEADMLVTGRLRRPGDHCDSSTVLPRRQ
ncbi:hypothetical protein [Brevundimonas goettingensis]|uniref:Uncharacterized protein n=1 Tax=Brevundimonas goettingensis TaxID=2774190 RepID=A0A975BYV7_9CAUL|nr:hypothetical protein [Brevundimonas goettingensis]QTC90453.1 hypothetical protein IFJ75_14370 [Brevundimonas goettingensis]